jgi:hypothetical protein
VASARGSHRAEERLKPIDDHIGLVDEHKVVRVIDELHLRMRDRWRYRCAIFGPSWPVSLRRFNAITGIALAASGVMSHRMPGNGSRRLRRKFGEPKLNCSAMGGHGSARNCGRVLSITRLSSILCAFVALGEI